jgi:type I restriction enzyme, S subunit
MKSTRMPLKHVTEINRHSLSERTPDDFEFRYVDISTVGRGRLVAEPERMRFAEAPSRARRLVQPGDTIVSTVRTYLRAVWPVSQPCSDLVVSTGFAVLSPRSPLDPGFFGWWAQSDALIEEMAISSRASSSQARACAHW